MKIRVTIDDLNQNFEGRDAADLLHQAKAEAAKRAPFFMKAIINGMSDLNFASEIVRRANQQEKRNDALPQSAEDFLNWAQQRNFITVLEK